MNDFDVGKKKLAAENADLLRQLEEADNQINQLAKIRSSLTAQLEDNKKVAEEESRVSHGITFINKKSRQSFVHDCTHPQLYLPLLINLTLYFHVFHFSLGTGYASRQVPQPRA